MGLLRAVTAQRHGKKITNRRGSDSGPVESRPAWFWNFLGILPLWVWEGLPAGLTSCSRNMYYERKNGVERQWKLRSWFESQEAVKSV